MNRKNKHSEKYWHLKISRTSAYIHDDDDDFIGIALSYKTDMDKANAKRIIACVNYCSGTSTKQLISLHKEHLQRKKEILDC